MGPDPGVREPARQWPIPAHHPPPLTRNQSQSKQPTPPVTQQGLNARWRTHKGAFLSCLRCLCGTRWSGVWGNGTILEKESTEFGNVVGRNCSRSTGERFILQRGSKAHTSEHLKPPVVPVPQIGPEWRRCGEHG
ncbi:hypothetical protein SKAU_G00134960 [Synaphobranchus kaupii]|uniref:Uncharacterized protein n=1 Tax=Synaphobranchus kaupii TaxID=118154 RepID=A0A9Q1FRW6_SYNKA|nr:hypothetical protein SKAU_G00134960 [Synaphobranchus kaupii]